MDAGRSQSKVPVVSLLKRVLHSMLTIAALAYLGITLLAHFYGDNLIFQPPPASYRDSPQIIKLASTDGARISVLYFAQPGARYTILYSHGNAEDIGQLAPLFTDISKLGFNVLAYDYRGYGTSSGTPSEQNAYRDADAAYDYLVDELHLPANRIIALGRSLGGGIAIDLASRRPLGGLIIESTFVSAYRVVTRVPLFPLDKFNSLAKLEKIHCPVLVIHGRNDEVVPFPQGERLFQAANLPKRFLWVDGAGHNDLYMVAGARYGETLREFAGVIAASEAHTDGN